MSDLRCTTHLGGAAVAASALVWPALALADGGHGEQAGQSDSTLTIVVLLALVASAYLLTHFVVGRIQRRFLVLVGIEYILLGVCLGPEVPWRNVASVADQLPSLLPIIALAVGWIGLVRGMELSFRRTPPRVGTGLGRLVVMQAVVAGTLTAALAYVVFRFVLNLPIEGEIQRGMWISVGTMGAAAAAGSTQPIDVLESRYHVDRPTAERFRRMAAASDLLAIVAFGLLFCIFHTTDSGALVQPSATEWAVVTVLLGALLGVLFTPFLGRDDSESGRFLAIAGIVILASGAAYFLDLSPLLVNLGLGVVLVNTAQIGDQIRNGLSRSKRPVALTLFVIAGAYWRPPSLSPDVLAQLAEHVRWLPGVEESSFVWLGPTLAWVFISLFAIAYILLRLVGKALGTRLASYGGPTRPDYYRALISHGEVSIAMAVSLRMVYEGVAVDLAYTAILVSVIINDLAAPRVLRSLLVDTGLLGKAIAKEAKTERA